MLTAQIRANESNSENTAENPAIYNIAFATEQPVTRFDAGIGEYQEVLLCNPENVDLTRLNSGTGTLLYNHDWNQHVGGIKSCTVDADKVCRADVQFSDYGIGPDIKGKVLEGTLQGVSFGYEIIQYELSGTVLSATKWAPYEISVVTVPADITVGLGRAMPVDTEEEEEQTEAVDNTVEENLENEPVTEQSEPDVTAESESTDSTENSGDTGESDSSETDEPAEVPQEIDNTETESAESESTVTESETDENSDNSINTNNESGDNTDNKEPDPAQANAEEDEKEIRAMASAFKFNQSATLDLVKQYQNGESLENIRTMIRSGTITTKNYNNKGTTTMSQDIKSVIRSILMNEVSALEKGNNGFKFKYARDLSTINSIGGNLVELDPTVLRPELFISPLYGVTALAKLPVTVKTGLMDSINIPCAKRSNMLPTIGTLANPADKFIVEVELMALIRGYINVYAPFDHATTQYDLVNAIEKVVAIIFNLIALAQEDLLIKTIDAKLPTANKLTGTTVAFDHNVLKSIGELSTIYPTLHLVMSPRTLSEVRQIKKGGAEAVATSEYLFDDTNECLRGVPVVTSSVVPDGVAYIGAWENGFIAQFNDGGEVEVLRDAANANHNVWVHASVAANAFDVERSFYKITLTTAP